MAKEKVYRDQDMRLVNRRDLKHALHVFMKTDEFKTAVRQIMAPNDNRNTPAELGHQPVHLIGHPGPDGTWIEHI